MEEDDDDLYDPAEPEASGAANDHLLQGAPDSDVKREDLEEGEQEEEEIDEEDSDDDIKIVLDTQDEPKTEPASQSSRKIAQLSSLPPSISTEAVPKASTPLSHIKTEPNRTLSPSLGKPGTDYPARHTSTVDVNANPVHPATSKPLLSTDFDTDFAADSDKPWRKPGADITDYFNYGFDEFTWASYCLKQQQMPKEIGEIKGQAEAMKSWLEGGAGAMPGIGAPPSIPGAPTGPGAATNGAAAAAMPGMPSETDMQQMFAAMMAQGMDPTQMDQNTFMQMMMGGQQGGGAGQAQQGFGGQGQGFGGNQQQQMGYGGGYEQPQPQPQQQQRGGYGGGRGRGGRRQW